MRGLVREGGKEVGGIPDALLEQEMGNNSARLVCVRFPFFGPIHNCMSNCIRAQVGGALSHAR